MTSHMTILPVQMVAPLLADATVTTAGSKSWDHSATPAEQRLQPNEPLEIGQVKLQAVRHRCGDGRQRRRAIRGRAAFSAVMPLLAVLGLAACSSEPARSNLLSDYSRQGEFEGRLAKRAVARPVAPLPAGAPLILETVAFAPGVEAKSGLPKETRDLVLNRFARDLCATLADDFAISDAPAPSQYRLRAFITELRPTGRVAAAVSTPIGLLSPLGGRLPIGLGALSTEVELLGPDGVQVASMTWRRAANPADSASVSSISDAYDFAGRSAEHFGLALAKGGGGPLKRVGASGLVPDLGLRRDPECARYGKGPGFAGAASGLSPIGVPPEWMDRGQTTSGEVTKPRPERAAKVSSRQAP